MNLIEHFLTVRAAKDGDVLSAISTEKRKSLSLTPRVYTLTGAQDGRAILCGEACLHKWVAANLGLLLEKTEKDPEAQ